jgi:hypothetical protein
MHTHHAAAKTAALADARLTDICAVIIGHARERLGDPEHWVKLSPHTAGRCCGDCMETALAVAQTCLAHAGGAMPAPAQVVRHVTFSLVTEAARRIYHEVEWRRPGHFNDYLATEHDDIMLVMDVAAEMARRGDMPPGMVANPKSLVFVSGFTAAA